MGSIKDLLLKNSSYKNIIKLIDNNEITINELIKEIEGLYYEIKKNDNLKSILFQNLFNIINEPISLEYKEIDIIITLIYTNLKSEIRNASILSEILLFLITKKANNKDYLNTKYQDYIDFLRLGYFSPQNFSQRIRFIYNKILFYLLTQINIDIINQTECITVILELFDSEKDPRNIYLNFQIWAFILKSFKDNIIFNLKDNIFELISCYFPIVIKDSNDDNKYEKINVSELLELHSKILSHYIFVESFINMIFEGFRDNDNDIKVNCTISLNYLLKEVKHNNIMSNINVGKILTNIIDKLKNFMFTLFDIDNIHLLKDVIISLFDILLINNNVFFNVFDKLIENILDIIMSHIYQDPSSKNSYISYRYIEILLTINNELLNCKIFYKLIINYLKEYESKKDSKNIIYLEELIKLIFLAEKLNIKLKFDNDFNNKIFEIIKKTEFKDILLLKVFTFYNKNNLNFISLDNYFTYLKNIIIENINRNNKNNIIILIEYFILNVNDKNKYILLFEEFMNENIIDNNEKIKYLLSLYLLNINNLSYIQLLYDNYDNYINVIDISIFYKSLKNLKPDMIHLDIQRYTYFLDYVKQINFNSNKYFIKILSCLIKLFDNKKMINYYNNNKNYYIIIKSLYKSYLKYKTTINNFLFDNIDTNNKYLTKLYLVYSFNNKYNINIETDNILLIKAGV